jgi:hypothetical protein
MSGERLVALGYSSKIAHSSAGNGTILGLFFFTQNKLFFLKKPFMLSRHLMLGVLNNCAQSLVF